MKRKWVHVTDFNMMESVLISKYQLLIKICVDSGYEEEAEKLRSEADSRGLKLNESISLTTYAELFLN